MPFYPNWGDVLLPFLDYVEKNLSAYVKMDKIAQYGRMSWLLCSRMPCLADMIKIPDSAGSMPQPNFKYGTSSATLSPSCQLRSGLLGSHASHRDIHASLPHEPKDSHSSRFLWGDLDPKSTPALTSMAGVLSSASFIRDPYLNDMDLEGLCRVLLASAVSFYIRGKALHLS